MKQLTTATLFLVAMLTSSVAIAQNAYQLFGPVDTRLSMITTTTPFGNSTVQLTCPSPTASITAVLSSSSSGTANVFADNFIGLSVNGNATVDVCPPPPGGYYDTQNNCFNGNYPGAYLGLTGNDPDTFVAMYGVAPLNISSDLQPGSVQAKFQLLDAIPGVSQGSSSLWLITNCTQNGVAPGGNITGNLISSSSPPPNQLTQNFFFDSTPKQRVQFIADYSAAVGPGLTILPNTIPGVSNQGIEPSAWPAVVANTSFSTTNCIQDSGALDPNGKPLCLFSTIQCTYTLPDGTTSAPAGDNCPQSTAKNVQMYHQFDSTSPVVTNFPKGTGLGFLEGSDSWPSESCSFVGPETGAMCPQNPITSFLGDYRSGSGGSTTNSTYIAVSGVPLPFTFPGFLPYSFGWSNSETVTLGFLTVPPIVPPPNNTFVAAHIKTLTYGIDSPAPYPDTSLPIPGDVTLPKSNPIVCPTVPTAGALPLAETDTVTLAEGQHHLHYFATDCAGTEELVFTPDVTNLGNWASFKTMTINVDITKPSVNNGPTLSPVGGTYKKNQTVNASYSCADPVGGSGAAPSGVVLCGPTLASLVSPTPSTGTLTSPVSTSTVGTHTFTVMVRDLAGNVGTPVSVSYIVTK